MDGSRKFEFFGVKNASLTQIQPFETHHNASLRPVAYKIIEDTQKRHSCFRVVFWYLVQCHASRPGATRWGTNRLSHSSF